MDSKNPKGVLELKDIFKIFIRLKWVFIITFLIVLAAGLLYTFLKTPMYESVSRLKLSGIYYNDDLLKYFPEDSIDIGVYPSNLKGDELEIKILNSYSKALREDDLLKYVAENIGNHISKDSISSSLILLIDNSNRVLLVKVLYEDPDTAYKINNELINTFIDNRKTEIESALSNIISKINSELSSLDTSINGENNNSTDSNIKIQEDLNAIKYNLVSNKDYILNNLNIVQLPSFSEKAVNVNHLKEILVILLMSVLAGLIAVFLPSAFLPLKTKNE